MTFFTTNLMNPILVSVEFHIYNTVQYLGNLATQSCMDIEYKTVVFARVLYFYFVDVFVCN